MSKFTTIIVALSVSSYSNSRFCFTYLTALFDVYIFRIGMFSWWIDLLLYDVSLGLW